MTALSNESGESADARSVTVAIEADDLVHAQRLTIGRNYRRPRVIFALASVPIAFAALFAGLIAIMDGGVRLADLIDLLHLVLVFYGVVAATVALRWVLVPRQARRMLNASPAAKHPVRLAWSDEGLTATSTYGTGTIPWDDLHGFAENRQVFAIYPTQGVAQTLPKRLLTQIQVDDFRRHLERIPNR